MFKKIIIVMLFSMCVIGCTTTADYEQNECYKSDAMLFKTNFNQETYVWESFLFPTNRTSGVQ